MSLRFNFQINFDVTFAFTSNSLRLNFRVHFDCTFDFMFDVTSIAILNSRSTSFRCHFRIHFDVTFEFTSRSLRFHTHIRFNVKDKIFPGDKRYDLPREKIKDTTPYCAFSSRADMTDTARTHARPNRNDFPVPGGCWLALSPPNLRSMDAHVFRERCKPMNAWCQPQISLDCGCALIAMDILWQVHPWNRFNLGSLCDHSGITVDSFRETNSERLLGCL